MNERVEITLLRHGRSLADDEGVHEGSYDSPLTEIGEQQATSRAESWREQGTQFDLIISSPLQRASRCAKIIGEALGIPVEVNEAWRERNNGPLAGLSFKEAEKQFPRPDFINPYQPYVVSADTGESRQELYSRAALALQDVVRRGEGRYLVVSHGGFLDAVLNVAVGNQPRANEQQVVFLFGDLHYMDISYLADRDVWVFRTFGS